MVFGLLVFSAVSDAFTGPMRKASVAPPKISITRVFMSEEKEKEDLTLVPSARKQIAFDEAKGRFFETDISDADCIPDEEFCITDNDSGSMIRLTIEEKERIFLDALQVRATVPPPNFLGAQMILIPCFCIALSVVLQQWPQDAQRR